MFRCLFVVFKGKQILIDLCGEPILPFHVLKSCLYLFCMFLMLYLYEVNNVYLPQRHKTFMSTSLNFNSVILHV